MKKQDEFVLIAAQGISNEGKGLITPGPPVLAERILKAERLKENAVFVHQEKLCNKEKLYEEVERQKEHYRPFFEDFAPALEEKRQRQYLLEFQWRIRTAEDEKDFPGVLKGNGKWENIKIPHFGEPRGVAFTYYRTEFSLGEWPEDKSIWLTFPGVDYKAHVFVNGAYLGSHEGFFAPFEFDLTAQAKKEENVLLVAVENDYIQKGSCSSLNGEEYTGDKFYAATGPGYDVGQKEITVDLSLYGQNFKDVQVEHMVYEPRTSLEIGMGDSFTEAIMKAEGRLGSGIPMYDLPVKSLLRGLCQSNCTKACCIW